MGRLKAVTLREYAFKEMKVTEALLVLRRAWEQGATHAVVRVRWKEERKPYDARAHEAMYP